MNFRSAWVLLKYGYKTKLSTDKIGMLEEIEYCLDMDITSLGALLKYEYKIKLSIAWILISECSKYWLYIYILLLRYECKKVLSIAEVWIQDKVEYC